MIFCVWKSCAFLSYKLLLFSLELLLFWMLNQIKSWVKWEVLILKIPLFLNCGESTILTFSIPCLGTCGSIASHVQGGWRTRGPAAWGPSCHWSWARLAWGAEAGGQLICSPPLRINGKMLTSGTSTVLLWAGGQVCRCQKDWSRASLRKSSKGYCLEVVCAEAVRKQGTSRVSLKPEVVCKKTCAVV